MMIMMSGTVLSVSLNEVKSPSMNAWKNITDWIVITLHRFVEKHFFSERLIFSSMFYMEPESTNYALTTQSKNRFINRNNFIRGSIDRYIGSESLTASMLDKLWEKKTIRKQGHHKSLVFKGNNFNTKIRTM